MNDKPNYKLKVVAGVHKNAELVLDPNTEYKIGSGDECDIVLIDDGVKEEHLTLSLSEDSARLEKNGASVFLDGKPLNEVETLLESFQIITVGEAHFSIAPENESWPSLAPPVLEFDPDRSDSTAFENTQNSSDVKRARLRRYFKTFYEVISSANKKRLAVAVGFIFLFLTFWIDFFISGPAATANERNSSSINTPSSADRKGLILSFINVISQVRDETMVGTGVKEPPVEIKKEIVANTDSADLVREMLKKDWGDSLTETPKNDSEIEYRGYDPQNQMDLQLNLNKENDGTLSANGFTLQKKQRKKIVAQLGDVIRVKVFSAEDMEGLCKKTLQKKKVKMPAAQFNMEKNSITLKGESGDHKIISEIEKIVAGSLPDVTVDNQVQFTPGKLDIVGVSSNGVAHVKLGDGSKVFPGGRLKNGCMVADILHNRIRLKCNGKTVYYNMGENV
jgi:hypothetical protein